MYFKEKCIVGEDNKYAFIQLILIDYLGINKSFNRFSVSPQDIGGITSSRIFSNLFATLTN